MVNNVNDMLSKYNLDDLFNDHNQEILEEVLHLQLSESSRNDEAFLFIGWVGHVVYTHKTISMVSNILRTGSTGLSTAMVGLTNVGNVITIIASGISIFNTFNGAKQKRDYFKQKADELEKKYNDLNDIEDKLHELQIHR